MKRITCFFLFIFIFSFCTLTGCRSTDSDSLNNSLNDSLESLTQITTLAIKEVESVTPSADSNERNEQYLASKTKLDTVLYELDTYAEFLEKRFEAGEIVAPDYHQQELELEELRENIRLADETLNTTFEIYD